MTKDQEKTIKDWELSCNLLAQECGKHLFGDDYDGVDDFWIGYDVGGSFDYNGCIQLTCYEMAEVLKENVTAEQVCEWNDANIEYEHYINLHSWLKGLRHEHLTNGG